MSIALFKFGNLVFCSFFPKLSAILQITSKFLRFIFIFLSFGELVFSNFFPVIFLHGPNFPSG